MKKFDNLLLDMSNIYHRSFATSQNMTMPAPNGDILITGGAITSLRTIRKLIREQLVPGGKIYCLYDSPTKEIVEDSLLHYSNYRREIDPDYKAHREPKTSEFYAGFNLLKTILLNYGNNIITVEIEGLEADDLVHPILEIETGRVSLMVSGDLDWARDISDNTFWMNHQKAILSISDFFNKYEFHPEKLEMQKCFRGDSSDGVPIAVSGIRTTVLNTILNKYTSLNEMKKTIMSEEFLSDTWKNKIMTNFGRLSLNAELVKAIPVDKEVCKRYIIESVFKPSFLRLAYKTLGLKISSIDPRLLTAFPEDRPTVKNFLQPEKLPRD